MATAELATGKSQLSLVTPSPTAQVDRWYKDAIVYQLHVRAFRDSNDDGIGDFRGLLERLDYIQELGVTAIWLQPFFPSPLRDDGYDIADYRSVNPQYGTLEDFQAYLEEAHRRELRVITELVMNHTSDQHEWFQRSRRAAPGSKWRDWYVWSDTPEKYQEARIIFQDFESSNWSWDPVAGAYFWHRFYSHQPDLNFDNPEVRQAMFDVLDFWLRMGVDGLRLDAVPYLFEREGTNCENLPETHAFLREVRTHIDAKFSDRMLLAEANQWPEDAAAYFGDGDECHMNFHFPLMPRLFMAVEQEDRSPIVDILEQTPLLPPSCQWATFLRNHDELTLEMVTDEERDYMYRTYAVDAKARINLGIRRRLAPLMGNNRRKIELMNVLLLTLPGTPILYYGDEIGMGDNYYLGDRNGVRTPMQWSGDRNAGFSRANPQSLYLPVIIDPEYHYELRNVEVQHANPHSQLWWLRRLLDLRKQFHAFGHGSFEALASNNPKVFAFLRETDEETLLVVANLSRHSQYVELDLSRFSGRPATELFGHTAFPAIREEPYVLSLGPHGYYWFSIGGRPDESQSTSSDELPTIYARGGWAALLNGGPPKLLRDAFARFLREQPWFAGKGRLIQAIDIVDAFSFADLSPASDDNDSARLLLVRVTYADGEPEAYAIPAVLVGEEAAKAMLAVHPRTGIVRMRRLEGMQTDVLCEAANDESLWRRLLGVVRDRRRIRGMHGSLMGLYLDSVPDSDGSEIAVSLYGGAQRNSSAFYDEEYALKLFRRISPGINPEYEVGWQLTEHTEFEHVPKVLGALDYRGDSGRMASIAVLHEYIPNVSDGWSFSLDELARYFERVQTRTLESEVLTFPAGVGGEPPQLAQETIGAYLHWAALMGKRVGELHVALATAEGGIAFSPEPFTRLYQRSLYQSMRGNTRVTLDLLRSGLHALRDETRARAEELLGRPHDVLTVFSKLLHEVIEARRIRCHGDLRLGQLLFTGKDFVIIDFEGDPWRPVSERRIKASPLSDVARMLRSIRDVTQVALIGQLAAHSSPQRAVEAEQWAAYWQQWVSAEFMEAYLAEAARGELVPRDNTQLQALLTAFMLDSALDAVREALSRDRESVDMRLGAVLELLH